MMKELLIDILMNTDIPVKCGKDDIGVCHISYEVAEKFADALISKGVSLSTETVAYLCDQKQCDNCSADSGFCYHTLDIHHAMNFEEIEPGKFIEKG